MVSSAFTVKIQFTVNINDKYLIYDYKKIYKLIIFKRFAKITIARMEAHVIT
jgi:hypothetical protein